jgi:outer membrane immunogenic protein
MKQIALALTSVLATGVIALAGTDDSKDMKQVATTTPPPSCDYTWTGFYLGAHIGYGWGVGDTSFEGLPSPGNFGALDNQSLGSDADGVFGGGQIGYNYQWNKLVFGFETDFSGSDFDGTKHRTPIPQFNGGTTPGTLSAHEDTDWFGTFRGRLGFTPFCRLLLYGTGGLAFGHTEYSGNTAFPNIDYPGRADETSVGWTAGGGAEYAISQHWSVKAEYLYLDFGSKGFTGNPNPANPPFQVHYNAQAQDHTVNIGLNYKF